MVIVGAIGTQIHSEAALIVGETKAESVAHKGVTFLELWDGKDHMSDPLGMRAQAPLAVLVEAPHVSGRIDRVRRAYCWLACKYSQAHGDSEVRDKACDSIRSARDISIARQFDYDRIQRSLRIYSPNHLAHTIAHQ